MCGKGHRSKVETSLFCSTAVAAAMAPQAWAWENHHGLIVIARRIWMDHSDSPETARAPEVGGDLNLSPSSWTEDREDDCR
jgi:hypothetical protein